MQAATEGIGQLANTRVPQLLPEQIERFTLGALKARPMREFDPQAALRALRASDSRTVAAVDIGGDNVTTASYEVQDGLLVQRTKVLVRGDAGAGYLTVLEELASLARRDVLTVGVSFAGPTDGTRLVAGPNVTAFITELYDQHDGDFANVFPWVAVANDAEAGIMAAALEAAMRYPDTRHAIYIINGSGLGGAVLYEGTIFATEPGHVEVEARLNPFGQRRPCGVLGATHVCLEAVAASKAGIEDIWLQQRRERRGGREITLSYLAGDQMALDLYGTSALVTAHVVKGMARAFDLPEDLDKTIVVGHGGIFHVAGYSERVQSILSKDLSRTPRMLFTKDFSTNACLDGAAIAAVMRSPG